MCMSEVIDAAVDHDREYGVIESSSFEASDDNRVPTVGRLFIPCLLKRIA